MRTSSGKGGMMRLKDLMEAPLIRDDDTVTLIWEIPGAGTVRRKGNWYQDFILEQMDREITGFTYTGSEKKWTVYLKGEEDEKHDTD